MSRFWRDFFKTRWLLKQVCFERSHSHIKATSQKSGAPFPCASGHIPFETPQLLKSPSMGISNWKTGKLFVLFDVVYLNLSVCQDCAEKVPQIRVGTENTFSKPPVSRALIETQPTPIHTHCLVDEFPSPCAPTYGSSLPTPPQKITPVVFDDFLFDCLFIQRVWFSFEARPIPQFCKKTL